MKSFDYIIKDKIGLHARPAGMLVKETKKYESKIMLKHGQKSADAGRILAIMQMGIKCGEEVTVFADGTDEETAISKIEEFFKANV